MAVSVACAFFLLRGYQRTKVRLLLFAGLGFCGISLNNVLLVLDAMRIVDPGNTRTVPTLLGLIVFIWGLIGERER
jgi:hypothetical protein